MSYPRKSPILRRLQRGFSLVTALFIIVALALLAAAIVSIVGVHHASSALDVQGARAFQAARAGIEWGLYQQLRNSMACPSANNFTLPAGSSLSGFTVSVTCTSTGALLQRRRQLTSVACNLPSLTGCPNPSNNADYVQRIVQVEF